MGAQLVRPHLLGRGAMVGAALAASAWLYDRLPDPMPIHWGLDGSADGWGPRALGAWLLPIVALAISALPSWLASRDRGLGERTRVALERTLTAATGMLIGTHALALEAALSDDARLRIGVMAAMLGALFVAIGLELPRTEPNRWIGIRLPSTRDPAVWAVAHRGAGRMFAIAGAIALVASVLLEGSAAMLVAIVAALGAALASTIYAWALARSRS